MASHGGGSGGGGGPHKFFKVLLPGSFEISLSLPPKFAAGLGVLQCRPWRGAPAKLRDRTGRSWDVDLRRDAAAHRVSFTGSGWRGFVSANAVSAGQLLVFEHHGGFDFAVDRFDASGCCCEDGGGGGGGGPCKVVDQHMNTTGTEAATDKESDNSRRRPDAEAEAASLAPPCTGVKRRRRSPSTATTVVSGGGDDNETLCRRIERPYQLRVLDLSKNFCERVGWSSSRDVVLCAAGGSSSREEEKRWQVSVKVSAKSGMMCGGWTEFAQDNGLAISDACVFVPLHLHASSASSDVLQVHLLRGGAPVASSRLKFKPPAAANLC